ncbi:MAG: hypothetical protein ABIL69_11420 [candidate division WOR-3 bacterium]
MKKFILIIIVFFFFVYPQPRVELGIKTTRYLMSEMIMFSQGTWNVDIFLEKYWGISSEIVISFTKNIYLRSEFLELKKYDSGGNSLNLLSNLNTDLIAVLPVNWNLRPLFYGGFSYEKYSNLSLNDYRGIAPVYNVRAGSGLLYTRMKNPKLFLEIEMYNYKQSEYRRVPMEDMIFNIRCESLGFNRVNLGLRFQL